MKKLIALLLVAVMVFAMAACGNNNDKESELDRLFYYNAVEFDIGVGLQKSFDDTWAEMESYFEENEDEIQQALEDYLG